MSAGGRAIGSISQICEVGAGICCTGMCLHNTVICYITSVVMGSGPGESCGGPTTSYTTSVLHAGISSFLESWTWTAITTTTVVTRICNRKKKSSPWQSQNNSYYISGIM